MNILLDTHVLLWVLVEPERISENVLQEIKNPANRIYVSSVSILEMVIKQSLGKLNVPDNIESVLNLQRFLQLPITFKHALHVGNLPSIHGDPFDRLLIAQAQEDGLILVTADRIIPQYPNIQIMKV